MNREYSDTFFPFGIRAFYHRFYIPFDKINSVSIDKVLLSDCFNIRTTIKGVPDYFTLPDKDLSDLVSIIEEKIRYNKNYSADANSIAAD